MTLFKVKHNVQTESSLLSRIASIQFRGKNIKPKQELTYRVTYSSNRCKAILSIAVSDSYHIFIP